MCAKGNLLLIKCRIILVTEPTKTGPTETGLEPSSSETETRSHAGKLLDLQPLVPFATATTPGSVVVC